MAETTPVPSKSPFMSKTNWVALLVAISSFIPMVSEWIAANPTMFATSIGFVFMFFRMITKGKISIE